MKVSTKNSSIGISRSPDGPQTWMVPAAPGWQRPVPAGSEWASAPPIVPMFLDLRVSDEASRLAKDRHPLLGKGEDSSA